MSWSQELGDKILQELPEELAASTSFKVDEKERLCMFFGFKLAGLDFQVVLDVVKRYQGDFVKDRWVMDVARRADHGLAHFF